MGRVPDLRDGTNGAGVGDQSAATVIEALAASLAAAARYNPNDAEQPAAVLWTDPPAIWQPIIPHLRRLMPQLLVFGEFDPEHRTGPAIWLRCMIERTLESSRIPDDVTPTIYLPDVSRQVLGAADTCPDDLKPLVELQYRGVCWTQKSGRDWTVEAFLVSNDGGLGLDVARDADTRQSMLRALTELATTPVHALAGRRLEAEDFDRLFSSDPDRDLLVWLSDSAGVRAGWEDERWSAFRSRCKADLGLDPEKDGDLAAAERLGRREAEWSSIWNRFAESPALYEGIPELLRRANPGELFVERSSWPQANKTDEDELRRALLELENQALPAARGRVIELEHQHAERRDWVWAKLHQAPLAHAIAHLAVIAERSSTELGGGTAAEMARSYADGAWRIDAAALSSMAAVKTAADKQAVSRALDAIYKPWLEAAALHLQSLEVTEPGAIHDVEATYDTQVESGTVMLFADGLRFDLSQRLIERLRTRGFSVTATTRWSGLPTVTATAKPAVSPVRAGITGVSPGDDFRPVTAADRRPLTPDRFRKLLADAGFAYLGATDTGDPAGRAWTESGQIDRLGHSLKGALAAAFDNQIELLVERVESLFAGGWREVQVVTDHGWLWLPGGLPKVDLPKYLTRSRWARCAAIAGESAVETPVVSWHWNAQAQVAVAPGIACFGAGHEYAHGGVSLQESLIPSIRVTSAAGSPVTQTKIKDVTWVGFRCRVRVDGAGGQLHVDLRGRVGDPASSVSTSRPVNDAGAASLLVADDDLEGTSAVVVVLDAEDRVIAKQSTIIGGEE